MKTILSIIILIIIYILLLINFPDMMNTIWWKIGLSNLNQKILEIKKDYDEKIWWIPTSTEFISGAIDIKNKIINWVDDTKEKIDSIRETMSWVEATYSEIKEWYDSVKSFIDSNSWTLDSIKWTINDIENIRDSINNTWTITN